MRATALVFAIVLVAFILFIVKVHGDRDDARAAIDDQSQTAAVR